jgi:UPF0042 nucleotide-binding protein
MIVLISFGYLHGEQPSADSTVDVRPYRDPHVDPRMRQLTGADQAVTDKVLTTPGIPAVVNDIVLDGVLHENRVFGAPGTIAVGCAGGRHRSVVVVNKAAILLRQMGHAVTVTHRDIDKPVVNR